MTEKIFPADEQGESKPAQQDELRRQREAEERTDWEEIPFRRRGEATADPWKENADRKRETGRRREKAGDRRCRADGRLLSLIKYVPITLLVFALAMGGGAGGCGASRELPGEAETTAESGQEEMQGTEGEETSGGAEDGETGGTSDSGDSPVSDSGASEVSGADGGAAVGNSGSVSNAGENAGTGEGTAASTGTRAVVHVCGAVRVPGVYELLATARVEDAVAAAGGFESDADTEYWNLAEQVADGEQIRIPTREESAELETRAAAGGTVSTAAGGTGNAGSGSGGASDSGESADGKVNLNTATEAELETLTGIGEVKAKAIIAYREANGPFQSIEDVMKVSGIKEAGFAKIEDEITV